MSQTETDIKAVALDAWLDEETDSGRFTSQDICDLLRETVSMTPDEATALMLERGWTLQRSDDRLVWVRI